MMNHRVPFDRHAFALLREINGGGANFLLKRLGSREQPTEGK